MSEVEARIAALEKLARAMDAKLDQLLGERHPSIVIPWPQDTIPLPGIDEYVPSYSSGGADEDERSKA